MAQLIKLKRTSVAGKFPSISNLELGELAMNTSDGRIFFEKNDGSATIQEIVTTNTNNPITGSINLNGAFTASSGVQVKANIMPNADNTLSLGSSTLRFQLNGGTPVTVSGTGTANTLTRFQSATTVEDSNIVSSDTATTFIHSNNGNTIFTVSGSNGELLTVTDSNTGNLLEVNDASGIDVFTVSAVGDVSASGAITASGFNVINDVSVTGNISGSSFNGTGLVSGSGGLSYATSTTRGVVELFSNTTQTVASNTVSTTANRTYGIQLNSANQAVVNVPWSNTTFSASDLNGTGVVSGSQQLNGFVSASGNFVSNELIVADGTNSVTSSNLLSVDSTNNRVGIGTSSPATKLHIAGDGANEGQIRLQQANNGGDGPDFAFYASRGTVASPSSVQDNDVQGRINAYAYNGSSFVQGGSFGWSSDGTNGDNDFTLSTRVDNSLGVKLRITNTGAIRFNEAYTFPISDGTANQVLQTDGSGAITFGTINGYTDANNTSHLNSLAVVSGSASQVLSFINVESNADVTDSTNVVSSLVSATSISGGNKTTIQSNLGIDSAGTDNSTDVTLTGTPDYITISGQVITRNQIDLANDVTGILPSANLDSDTAHLSGTQTFSGAKTFSATGNSIIIGDTLRIDENGSGLRMTNVGAFDNSSGNFRIFSNSDLILSTNGDSGTAVTFDSTTKDATFEGNILAGNISGSSFNGTGLISSSAQLSSLNRFDSDVSGNPNYTITHNLSERYVIVQCYDSNYRQVIPSFVSASTDDSIEVEFNGNFAGRIVVKK